MPVRIGAGLLIVGVIAAIVVYAVTLHQWYSDCHDLGGRVEQRFEYASVDLHNHYDSKGNLSYVTVDTTRHYSYHCWANGQEVLDSWMS